ncbi:Mitochondrial matrix iron chaperone [Coemansia interrupta]|uniref:ferroxidase n=1 Tax=Coemansia interrupta TaxID=1126814 RepID=A0A9W8HPP1_9FUNG|nr:Mitochondrial matrix iron chaperone [Coemansia interrupta]
MTRSIAANAQSTLKPHRQNTHTVPSILRHYQTHSHTESPTAKKYTMASLSDSEYHDRSSRAMDALTEYFEDLGDELENDNYDVEYSSGVLTLKLASHGTYVINKQPPNKQIWLSSPFSGPERYDYDREKEAWFCRHKDESLGALLSREVSEALETDVVVPIN